MKTFSILYFLISFFLLLGESSNEIMILKMINMLAAFLLAKKFAPNLFHKN